MNFVQHYKTLMCDETYRSPTKKDVLKRSIHRTYLLSKSGGAAFSYCQKQCQYDRCMLAPRQDPRPGYNDDAVYGSNIHKLMDLLLRPETIPYSELVYAYTRDRLVLYLFGKLLSLVPDGEVTDWVISVLYSASVIEAGRITDIFDEVPLSEAAMYIYPLAREIHGYNFAWHIHGIIDRVDLLPSGDLCIVDYKTGKPKYFDNAEYFKHKSYKKNYDIEGISYELGFYKLVLDNCFIKTPDGYIKANVKGRKIYGNIISLADPTYRKPIYIDNLMVGIAYNIVNKYQFAVKTGTFTRNFDPVRCCMWCGYYHLCTKVYNIDYYIEQAKQKVPAYRLDNFVEVVRAFEVFGEQYV